MSKLFPPEHDSQKGSLWLKAFLVLDACIKGIQPFVGLVMQRLHVQVIAIVEDHANRDIEKCTADDWDCSKHKQADDAHFTEDWPLVLNIRSMDSFGVADLGDPHFLKPHVLMPCILKDIPAGYFHGPESISPHTRMFICRNPADPADSNDFKSSTVVLLPASDFDSKLHHCSPFQVTRCFPKDPELQFYAVLCSSRPAYTKLLVVDPKTPAPRGPPDSLSFGFWALKLRNSETEIVFEEFKHGLKQGHVLRFSGKGLPPEIVQESLYIVSVASTFSFQVSGPILRPVKVPDLPFVIIRTSPVARFRDTARQFHLKGPKSVVSWLSIKAHRLSSHHGEFCKLFCCQTSRDLEFFSDSGTRSGEQLLNMIDNCSAFSPGKDNLCTVFCELFNVVPGKLGQLSEGLDRMRGAAVGRHSAKSKDPTGFEAGPGVGAAPSKASDQGIRDIRNKLAHNTLLCDDHLFEILVSCTRKLLEAIYSVAGCVVGELDTDSVKEALAEIERIQKRDLHIVPLSDSERNILHHWIQENKLLKIQNEILQEKAKGLYESRPFILKKDIEEQLVPCNQIGDNGSQGVVYKICYRDQFCHRDQLLAVKIFLETGEGKAWRRELTSLTFLTHENIVRIVYIVYENAEDPFKNQAPLGYAMELMSFSAAEIHNLRFDATPLSQGTATDEGDLSCFHILQYLSLLEQIAEALSFAHTHGVVHFDVKPHNILLNGTRSVAKLCDFGCAHKLQSDASAAIRSVNSGPKRGTATYMAPEANDLRSVPAENFKLCDVFSFGKTMGELLCRFRTAESGSRQIEPTLPVHFKELSELVDECTKTDPFQRPQSMSDVLCRLKSIREYFENVQTHGLFDANSFTGASKFFLDIYLCFNFPPAPGTVSRMNVMWRFWFWVFLFYAFLIIMLWFGIEACVIFVEESSRNPYSSLTCPALNSSMMPQQYALTAAAGYHGRMFVRSLNIPDIVVENRCYPMSSGARGSFLWIGNKLVAFSETNDNIYDCQRNLIYKACYDCDSKLMVYASDQTYIWSSGIPKIVSDSSDEQTYNQVVYGQPSNIPVAIVSKNLTISIYNSSHPASDPRLLITTFSRAYFLAKPMDDCNANLWQKIIFSMLIGIFLLLKCVGRHYLIQRCIIKCRYIYAKICGSYGELTDV